LAGVASEDQWRERVVAVIDKALAGEYPFFGHWFRRLGWPPDFNLDPVHNIRWPVGAHCLKTARSGPPRDDIKLVWEASRFSLAYHLARAYARSRDERFAEAFWRMFDAWGEQNPPMLSVAWGCGQESTFRLMAMLFAAVMTLNSPSATNERLWALSRYAWQVGRLVEVNINYARSQKNNHAISEATALWTVGLMFPEFRQAGRWKVAGRGILAAEVRRQVYDDGSYVQHSLNYHRVMMDDLLWAIRLGELHDLRLGDVVYDRFRRATEWLLAMIDPVSGRVPNYGPNDGAQVLPLSTCDYLDYRPVAQAASHLVNRKRVFGPGPWDEKMLWLCGPQSLSSPISPPDRPAAWSAPAGGYYILRGRESQAMIRSHSYRDRPTQADMLHVDLWWRGENVLRDGGSYLYYHADPRWKHWFISTAAHNTVEIDGQDQMTKGPRFTWLQWTKARVLEFGEGRFVGEQDGYRRLGVRHRRSVEVAQGSGECYEVTDTITGRGTHDVVLRWRLCDAEWKREGWAWSADMPVGLVRIALDLPPGFEATLNSGQEDPIEGWESLYYGEKQPAPTLAIRGRPALPATLKTTVSFT
ncbi:MAG: alginate lyase family protein, partial [Phycisphaerae bacterium]|nr:alginate lyase family protein [Phycisphaerae bacterium]